MVWNQVLCFDSINGSQAFEYLYICLLFEDFYREVILFDCPEDCDEPLNQLILIRIVEKEIDDWVNRKDLIVDVAFLFNMILVQLFHDLVWHTDSEIIRDLIENGIYAISQIEKSEADLV